MKIRARVLFGMLAIGLIGISAGRADASVNPSSLTWLVKSNDLQLIQAQATMDGVVLPNFQWVGCGGLSDPLPCPTSGPPQIPLYTSYFQVAADANHHVQGVDIFDIETWKLTPAQQRAHPLYWICKAAELKRRDRGLHIVITPYNPVPSMMVKEDATAARCGAFAIDLQSQFANGYPYSRFARFMDAGVDAIRANNSRALILAGLATNQATPQTVPHLVSDYHVALRAGVGGFWLNAANWGPKNQCTPAEGGPGCPEIAIQFLQAIGYTGSGRGRG
jgi:hypothetical protein